MNTCEFCKDNLPISFGDRIYAIINDFAIAQPRDSLHEFHLLIFDTVNHENRLHDYSSNRIVDLKNLISSLDNGYSQGLTGYLGYNLTSNNGDLIIGQHVEHSHIHMFMRFNGERKGPFDKNPSNIKPEYPDRASAAIVTDSIMQNIQNTQLNTYTRSNQQVRKPV